MSKHTYGKRSKTKKRQIKKRKKAWNLDHQYHFTLHSFNRYPDTLHQAYGHIDYGAHGDFVGGFRLSRLYLVNGTVLAGALHQQVSYPLRDAKAICLHIITHAAPAESCTCGFYTLNTIRDMEKQFTVGTRRMLLQVRLWGTVIEGPNGKRSEYMSTERIILLHCHIPGCVASNTVIYWRSFFGSSYHLEIGCRTHNTNHPDRTNDLVLSGIDELRDLLGGIEVEWASPEH